MGAGWLWILVPLIAVGLLFRRVFRRSREFGLLARDGRRATGRVEELPVHRDPEGGIDRHELVYSFSDHIGRRRRNTIAISASDAEGWAVGDPIEVVFLAANPEVSAAADMVERVRTALEQRDTSR